jgi:penicillin-binding protein 2
VEGYTVAGKTGTAQVYKMSAGIDADKMDKATRDHAWFAGYAPADNPRIAFAVVVEHGGHGGTTAAPIARKVLKTFFAKEANDVPGPPEDRAGRGRGRRERGGSYATAAR